MATTTDFTIPTPCPAPKQPQKLTILPTPQLGLKVAPLRGVKPRRPGRSQASLGGWDPTLDIYDDTFANIRLDDAAAARTDQLGQLGNLHAAEQLTASTPNSANTRKRRILLSEPLHAASTRNPAVTAAQMQQKCEEPTNGTDPVKKARRRTIYIPSEDTTIMTIHPGASLREQARRPKTGRRSDIFLDLAVLSEEETVPSERASPARVTTSSQFGTKGFAAAPKRVPLARSQRSAQLNGISRDVMGVGGGKENLPPGWIAGSAKKNGLLKPKRILEESPNVMNVNRSPKTADSTALRKSIAAARGQSIAANTIRSSPARTPELEAQGALLYDIGKIDVEPQSAHSDILDISNSSPASVKTVTPPRKASSPAYSSRRHAQTASVRCCRQSTAVRPTVSDIETLLKRNLLVSCEQYPILQEDIPIASLYTSEHLTSQDIALSQMVNEIFASAGHGSKLDISYAALRKDLMAMHNTEATVQLQQRLQASLRFGALSISKDGLAKVCRIKDDLAQRQAFLELWTKTYDLQSLQAAAEVVIGRECTRSVRVSGSPTASSTGCGDGQQRQVKSIQAFLRTFLLRNDDAPKANGSPASSKLKMQDTDDDINTPAWLWRRTVIRSLFLVRLLDTFASTPSQTSTAPSCLFQPTSPHKSSASVLLSLGTMLLPSLGDVSRVLKNYNLAVSYVQHPLQEYEYRVKNLAVDMRDGVLLTRLVETVLYNSAPSSPASEDTTSIHLISSPANTRSAAEQPLSPHLHYPAPTRSHKLHNARLILSALLTHAPGNAMLGSALAAIEPQDVVDGHREKTMALLWALVLGCGGLEWIVKQDVLGKELERVKLDNLVHGTDIFTDTSTSHTSHDDPQSKLFAWAQHVTTKHGIPITNMTSSFADGRAYEALAREYGYGCMAEVVKTKGWDVKFGRLFAVGEVPAREVTVALLAVLAGALLG